MLRFSILLVLAFKCREKFKHEYFSTLSILASLLLPATHTYPRKQCNWRHKHTGGCIFSLPFFRPMDAAKWSIATIELTHIHSKWVGVLLYITFKCKACLHFITASTNLYRIMKRKRKIVKNEHDDAIHWVTQDERPTIANSKNIYTLHFREFQIGFEVRSFFFSTVFSPLNYF